jgi:hypothetical protein
MPRFVIEREIPNAGKLTTAELREISVRSCDVIRHFGHTVQWIESFVTDNKIYCVYLAPDKEILMAHSVKGELPVDRIEQVSTTIGPATAE